MTDKDVDSEVISELLTAVAASLQTLLSGMLEHGKRNGSLHVRPTINGTAANYMLRFDLTATLVPDAPQKRRRTKR